MLSYLHWIEPWPARPGKLLLTVVEQLDGRVLKHVCNDEAHAADCLPILEAMLARSATTLSGAGLGAAWPKALPPVG